MFSYCLTEVIRFQLTYLKQHTFLFNGKVTIINLLHLS